MALPAARRPIVTDRSAPGRTVNDLADLRLILCEPSSFTNSGLQRDNPRPTVRPTEKEPCKMSCPLRIGAVNYLNTRPLIYGLQRAAPDMELVLDVPSRLADGLADGRYDLALIPSIEFLREPTYVAVSDAAIACRGPVLSVKLLGRVAPDRVRTLALDEGSRTSVALVRILLHQRYGLDPQLTGLPLGASPAESTADAVLVIGDRAMHSPGGPWAFVWDLGDEWFRATALPFVFAMWTARAGFDVSAIETRLSEVRDDGVAHLEEIARAEGPRLGLTVPQCLAYLRDNLHFTLGPRELQGLEKFRALAAELELVGSGENLGSLGCHAAR